MPVVMWWKMVKTMMPLAYLRAPASGSLAGMLRSGERRGMAPEIRRRRPVRVMRQRASERVS